MNDDQIDLEPGYDLEDPPCGYSTIFYGGREPGDTESRTMVTGPGNWIEELARLRDQLNSIHDYGIDTRSFGDGDANAVWNRVDAFRNDPEAVLDPEDVRELAEWWAELHTTVSELDEKLCQRDTELSAWHEAFGTTQLSHAKAENEKLKLKARYADNAPFCPDHRDKVRGLPCRECEIERLRAIVDTLRIDADGLPLAEGQQVWYPPEINTRYFVMQDRAVWNTAQYAAGVALDAVHSTRAAAAQAEGKRHDQNPLRS